MSIFGGIASAVGSVAGGVLGLVGSNNSAANAAAINRQNYEAQKEFAQNGIRWKVADAKAAGLHPLAALGAQTSSYSPSAVVGDSPDYSFLRDAGQGIGRAVEAKMTQRERDEEEKRSQLLFNMQLKNAYLEGEERKARIRGLDADTTLALAKASESSVRNQQQVPALPSLVQDGAVIPGQSQSRGVNGAFPTGDIQPDVSSVPTSVRGVPSVQAGTPPDVRFYLGTGNTRVPLPTEQAADAMDAAFFSGLDWSIRNKFLPILSNYLPFIPDSNRRPGEYYDPIYGGYRKGKTFHEKWGY